MRGIDPPLCGEDCRGIDLPVEADLCEQEDAVQGDRVNSDPPLEAVRRALR